jgi:transcription factor 1
MPCATPDEIISYIGPTLKKHMHCDILDLNPGIGVWSSKLHQYLQPRTHILLEPHLELYKNQLNPLLKSEGSTYKLVEGDPHEYATYEKLIKDGHFPHQIKLDKNDPRIVEPNNTLLITGSLNIYPAMPGYGAKSVARQVLKRLVSDAWEQKLMHVYGRVRILVWIQSEDKKGFIAESTTEKSTYNILANKLFHVREVVAPEPEKRQAGATTRELRYKLQSTVRAITSMRELGLELPSHRQSVLHQLGNEIVAMGIEDGDAGIDGSIKLAEDAERRGLPTIGLLKDIHRDRIAGEVALTKDPSIQYMAKPVRPRVSRSRNEPNTTKRRQVLTEWGKCHSYNVAHIRVWINDRKRRLELVAKGMEIFRTECELLKAKDEAEKQKLQATVDRLNIEFKEGVDAEIPSNRAQIATDLDDHYAINSPSPLLDWDNRSFDPIQAHRDEFWPASRTSLLDLEPRSLPPSATPPKELRSYTAFVSDLMKRFSFSTAQGLENVQNGASELLEVVPEVRDPTKGGRPDLRNLRARLLNTDLIDTLYRAYKEWPFRTP